LQYSTINIWENRAINKFIEEIIIEEAGKDKIGLGKTNFTKTKDPEIIKLFLEIASTTLNDLKILYILTPKQRDKIEDLFAKASQQSIINTRQQN
jgi:hypothetical protein